ncbi:MAG: hypothetical protein AAFQ09_07875 [Pseudomonadota bacterium]
MGLTPSQITNRQLGSETARTFVEVSLTDGAAAPQGNIADNRFTANDRDRRPPRGATRFTNMVVDIMSGFGNYLKGRFEAHTRNSPVARPLAARPSTQDRTEQGADIDQPRDMMADSYKHYALHADYISKTIEIGQVEDRLSPAGKTRQREMDFILMFGREDRTLADVLLKETHAKKDVAGKLDRFLLQNGSFEAVDDVAHDHFAYDPETKIIQISASILAEKDGQQLCVLLDANLAVTDDFDLIIGEDKITAHKLEQQEIAAEKARVKRPEIDLTKDVPELVTITGSPRMGQRIGLSDAYLDGKNGQAILDVMSEKHKLSEVPTESDIVYAAMFGTDSPPAPGYLNAMLADPQLKKAIQVFLHDGGTFKAVFGADKMEYRPDQKVIEVPFSMANRGRGKMEDALRDLLQLPKAVARQDEAVVEQNVDLTSEPTPNDEPPTDVASTGTPNSQGDQPEVQIVAPSQPAPAPATSTPQPAPEAIQEEAITNHAEIVRPERNMKTELDQLSQVKQQISILQYRVNQQNEPS